MVRWKLRQVARAHANAFKFVTNRERSAVFGYGPSGTPVQRVHMPPREQTRIFFNAPEPMGRVRCLAFDGAGSPSAQRDYPPSLVPSTPRPDVLSVWLFSSCSLEGLVRATLCRNTSLAHRPVIGMLLQYRDESQASLGQFRFDFALETIHLEPATQRLYICSRLAGFMRYVAHVTIHRPGSVVLDEYKDWFHARLDGTLEWWFSDCESLVKFVD